MEIMEKIMVLGKEVPVQIFERVKECEDMANSKAATSHESTGYFMEGRGVLRGAALILGIDFGELRERYIDWYLDHSGYVKEVSA